MRIGEKIKAAREERALTQTQAAEALRVSRQTVSNWETGRSLPDIVSVLGMSRLYGLSLDALLQEDDEMLERLRRDAADRRRERRILRFGWTAVLLGAAALVLDSLWGENPVLDFARAALPWLLLGTALLLWLTEPARSAPPGE